MQLESDPIKLGAKMTMKCDVCKREFDIIAIRVSVCPSDSLKGRFEKQMFPYKINKEYNICYPCYFKSLGIKPDEDIND